MLATAVSIFNRTEGAFIEDRMSDCRFCELFFVDSKCTHERTEVVKNLSTEQLLNKTFSHSSAILSNGNHMSYGDGFPPTERQFNLLVTEASLQDDIQPLEDLELSFFFFFFFFVPKSSMMLSS